MSSRQLSDAFDYVRDMSAAGAKNRDIVNSLNIPEGLKLGLAYDSKVISIGQIDELSRIGEHIPDYVDALMECPHGQRIKSDTRLSFLAQETVDPYHLRELSRGNFRTPDLGLDVAIVSHDSLIPKGSKGKGTNVYQSLLKMMNELPEIYLLSHQTTMDGPNFAYMRLSMIDGDPKAVLHKIQPVFPEKTVSDCPEKKQLEHCLYERE